VDAVAAAELSTDVFAEDAAFSSITDTTLVEALVSEVDEFWAVPSLSVPPNAMAHTAKTAKPITTGFVGFFINFILPLSSFSYTVG